MSGHLSSAHGTVWEHCGIFRGGALIEEESHSIGLEGRDEVGLRKPARLSLHFLHFACGCSAT